MSTSDAPDKTTPPQDPASAPEEAASFAETALKLGGKSEEEARRTGAIDRADDQVESLFQPQYQTVNSPAHRAVWDRTFPVEEFQSHSAETPPEIQKVMDDSIAVVKRHKDAGTLLNEERKIPENVIADLAAKSATGGCWSRRNTVAAAHRFAALRRSSRGWRWSIPHSPGWLRCMAASERSTR